MNDINEHIVANYFRNIARFTGLIFGVLIFLFALISGSEAYGGGIDGLIKNSPNALPWAIFLLLIAIAWKWELLGGIFVIATGVYLLFFFKIFSVFNLAPFIIILLVLAIGVFFILSFSLRR